MNSRILIYGAGAIGSIFAGKLAKSGNDITLLARGNRFEEISKNGVILKNALNHKVENYHVKCIKELSENDIYDYILVVVQNNQVDSILPILSRNKTPNIVFVVNNPLGYSKYIDELGAERVMIGFPSAGGERKNGVVTYFIGTGIARIMQTTTFGEIDGSKTVRLKSIIRIFRKAGFEPIKSKNIDAWQKTHIAFVTPIGNALYRFNSNNYELAKSRETIKLMILAIREGFKALNENGIKIEPKKLNYYNLPSCFLILLYQIIFNTKIAEYAMAKHTIVAKEEMDTLEKQFLNLYKESSFENWKALHLTTAST
jgi:2-dehydropantoate 2-reductase